jgi:signal transduction histidine kinase
VYLDGGEISGEWFATLSRGTTKDTQDFPIRYRGEQVAVMSLAPRRTESDFTARDRRVLAALISHAAPALHGDRVLTDLAESRQRAVSVREEERRRLRRDLHDDLGPALSGLSLSAAALARRTGLPEARELQEDIQQAMLHSRQIAYGLRPPILDDHGLAAAILDRSAADDDLEVRVTAPEFLDLPAAVDLAALRIVTEAVANARKHAEATAVDVALTIADGHLEITVSDDGVGLRADVRPGIGMHSIAERAAEVGGTARYDRAAAGTHLRVRLPLEPT